MKAHTPGPWEVSDTGGNIYGATGDVVASIHGLPKPHLAGERRANALLVAAAPELLEALEKCRKALEVATTPLSMDREEVIAAQNLARYAIAKATGEAP